MEDYLPILEQTTLFEGVAREDIATLCRALGCHRAYYSRGSLILRRDERVERAGIVLSGGVQAERNGADGTLRVIARHGAGALFGDLLTVSRRRRSPVDIVASEDTAVLFVPLAVLMGDAVPHGAVLARVRLNLLAELSDKYWALSAQMELLQAPTLRAKLARRLLAERRAQDSDHFRLSGTRETLAAELGVNRSALSRVLGELRRDGLLEAQRGSFVLRDVEALRKIAGE